MRKFKIIDFKAISPLFEMERDGEKPFITGKIDPFDKRFRALSQWVPQCHWGIRITNPATGESFVREIESTSYLHYFDFRKGGYNEGLKVFIDWRIIILGEKI